MNTRQINLLAVPIILSVILIASTGMVLAQQPPPPQLQISDDGILTSEYFQFSTDRSADVFFPSGTQFMPAPSNIVVETATTDFDYSVFVGDRSVAFTTDNFFALTLDSIGTNTIPKYHAIDSTDLVDILECIANSFNGNRLVGIEMCYTYYPNSDTIGISTTQSGNYVLISDGTPEPIPEPEPAPVNPLTVTDITATGTENTTITETITVTNVPSGYTYTSISADSALTTTGVSISGTESGGIITVSIGLPSAQTITGNIIVSYGDGTNTLTSNSAVSLTVNSVPTNPSPVVQLPLQISADGILTNNYSDYLGDTSISFIAGTQFTPVPSNIVVESTGADSVFVGDRSVAFTVDEYFVFSIFFTGPNTVPYYYASDSTVLVEIPLCTPNFFNGDRPAGDLEACYVSYTASDGTIEIRTTQSGNYVLVSEDDTPPTVHTTTNSISLDRAVYPVPFGIPSDFGANNDNSPNGRSIFPIHATGLDNTDGLGTGEFLFSGNLVVHIRVNDPDFNVNPSDQDALAQNVAGEEYGPIKISVLRGSSTVILGYAGGPDSNDGMIGVGDTDSADLRQFGPIDEIAFDAGIYEFDLHIRFTDGPADSQCPNDVRYGGTTNTASERFNVPADYTGDDFCILQGDILQVEYTDPTGDSNTVTDSATFDLRNGVLQTDKSVFIVGSDMILTLIDFDLDLDNEVEETYDLDLIEWDSDTATLTMGNEGGETTAFDPDFRDLRETGDSTGIFQTVIKIPEELKGDKLGRGEEIILEYTDWGPSDSDYVGDAVENINWNVFTSNFGATVEFDQQSYTWTDKVYITLIAPDFNFDADLADEIGGSDNPITISTRGFDLYEYTLVEMDTDTGFFDGEVLLTGFTHDADGDPTTGINGNDVVSIDPSGTGPTDGLLPADDDDNLTVSFEFSEDRTIMGTALIRWNIGEVQWLDASSSTAVVRVVDPDMNLDPEVVDNFSVDVWSDSDFGGIDLTVTETNDATGIFEGTVFFTGNDESSGHRLRVAEGDTVTAEYEDHTLPSPHTTADELDITATLLMGTMVSPFERESLPVVEFDQQVYTWTDKVYITIVAPDHNFDGDLVDEIGGSDNPIMISTRGGFNLDGYKLVETGIDTGIFTGEVILTGFTHDADGDTATGIDGNDVIFTEQSGTGPTDGLLPADDDSGITVSFEFSEDETVVGSALIRWNIGEVQWLETSYPATGTGIVRVIDPDMNLDPEVVDNFSVDVWSDSDAGGINLTVTETDETTGIFEGTVFFTVDESSGHMLRVAEGDTILAEYEDNTLPDPYTMADELDITAISLIVPLLEP